MATTTEPPPKHVKLRYRALAYVRRFGRHQKRSPRPRASSRRSFADTGGARPPIRITSPRRFSDSGGARPVVRVASKRSFTESNGARPVVRVGSRRSFADSGGARPVVRIASKRSFADSNPGPRSLVECNEAPAEIKVTTRSRRASRARRQKREKRRHRFLPSLHSHGGHRFRLFCGCCVEQDAIDPAETPSSVDISTVGARAASLDSGFGYTCASPVSCPPPHGLVPTRTFPTTLKLRSRDGTGNGKFTLHTGTSGFASTGFKRKAPSSSSYPSYTPTTPPSPFMNDFIPTGTFNNTRARSRVSVGCNGWFLHDDDPSIVGLYRRRSSGGEVPKPIITHLSQVAEGSQDSEAEYDREGSPKR
ncbi:hypothetical protein PHYSODRAFT_483765, partial [Phytophthora sojae]